MKILLRAIIALFAAAVITVLSGTAYTVTENEQVVVTQFGRPVGKAVTKAGLHFKLPFIQKANSFDKRALEWDGPAIDMLTKDKTFIVIDTFGRWQITDVKQFFLRLRDDRSAQSRLDDILGSATLATVANHDLIEAVRTSKDRVPVRDETLEKVGNDRIKKSELKAVRKGRVKLEEEIFAAAEIPLRDFGIKLLNVRFKRINYHPSVVNEIHNRMISERQQIAAGFRSTGAGEAARIMGTKERELKTINSQAYREVEEIRGTADAKAIAIYAEAYNQSEEAAEFYQFTETLKVYKESLGKDSSVILSTDSELFRFLEGSQRRPKAGAPVAAVEAQKQEAPKPKPQPVQEAAQVENDDPFGS
ncbi:MAG: membrane protease subunit HflC [Verrucomicrobiales bacterium]|jgi:membrane protease subunit HflC